MTHRVRPFLLGAALLLAGLALPPRAQAAFGCVSGSWDWRNTGDCCVGTTDLTTKLHGFRCVNGIWTFTSSYICLEEPCAD